MYLFLTVLQLVILALGTIAIKLNMVNIEPSEFNSMDLITNLLLVIITALLMTVIKTFKENYILRKSKKWKSSN